MMFRCACLAGLVLVAACGRKETRHGRGGPMAPPAFWVWHRGSELKPAERGWLVKSGVRMLYWQAAECGWKGAEWSLNPISRPQKVEGLEVVPVFRIKPESAFLGAPRAAGELAARIRKWSDGAVPGEVQLDFDCPDRLLENYARFLKAFGAEIAPCKVSLTALASWPQRRGFHELARAASSFVPMFYDLKPDDPSDVRAGRFQPMADPAMAKLIAGWAACPKPWRAGLPNFERLSVFAEDGKLTGHLRGWQPDSVFFHPELKRHPLDAGVTWFEPTAAFDWSATRIAPGMKLVHRTPDLAVLIQLAKAADLAGADGVVYFTLPGPGIQAAFSAEHLTHPEAAARLEVRVRGNGAVVLSNPGPVDLSTRVWELELGGSGAFRSASPGGFAELDAAGPVPPELAESVVLRFSKLNAGESIISGTLIGKREGLVWKIRGLTENQPVISEDSAR